MHSDGSGGDLLSLPGGGSHYPASEQSLREGRQYIHMDGREVFRFATRVMGQAAREALELAGLTTDDVQWIIPHQANYRIIETAAKYLKMPLDRFVINVDRYGNTSTASIPIATVEAFEKGLLKNGDKIVLVGLRCGAHVGRAGCRMDRTAAAGAPRARRALSHLGLGSLALAAHHALHRRPDLGPQLVVVRRPRRQWQVFGECGKLNPKE